ncbi:sugar phosphate isomerase/epimerase family protein [Citrobacter freundii]|uniref:sugar phosphate isomerase/epimerase family protein n=1 Tax=Citrobacter freundii TaxID=546 RepID=UPI0024E099E3|nr:sugar phosphate isomerase/epimerase [Citrobacter freundii]WOR56975.1 sugar phosphate isomerase/epimerase [Citrobacter freundii]
MKISISNLAWDVSEDKQVLSLLKEFKVDSIDIAPGKYFPTPSKAKTTDILAVRQWWNDKGIDILGMQSLLFGTQGLNVFGNKNIQDQLLSHLAEICRIGATLGARRLVFGSPKNRDRSGLSQDSAIDIANEFFHRLGNVASDEGVIICLEPNPEVYGSNFLTSSYETYEMVKLVAHPAIKMQLDTGAVILNNEDFLSVVKKTKDVIGHVHISEANLATVGDTFKDHELLAAGLKSFLPDHPITIEMLAAKDENHIIAIRRALKHVTMTYC